MYATSSLYAEDMLPLPLPLFHLSISLHLYNFFHLLPPPNTLSDSGLSTLSFHQSPTSLSGIFALSLDLRFYNSLRLSPSPVATISLLSVSRSPGRICRRRDLSHARLRSILRLQLQERGVAADSSSEDRDNNLEGELSLFSSSIVVSRKSQLEKKGRDRRSEKIPPSVGTIILVGARGSIGLRRSRDESLLGLGI
ncbi:unnamed protein product [Linum trigynum]|uniref:Uncharacterized protein n=1 Tax=Linum trigynum TaxID=586398 RepID=A0AAV2DHL9_9ROSI